MKLGIKQALTAVAAFGFVTTGAASAWASDHYVAAGFNLPTKVSAAVEFNCANHPGPTISFGPAKLTFGDVSGRFTFSNNMKLNTHVAEVEVQTELLLNGQDPDFQINIPKQPSRDADSYGLTGTGVGGNPWIYAQINDGKYILLGRCVQGAAAIDTDLLEAVLAAGTVHVDGDCYNHPGPFVTLDGTITFGPVKLTIIFTNNRKFTHAAAGDFTAEFDLIPADGDSIVLPKQPPLGGVGGNPHIWFQFLNGDEPVYAAPGYYLGRCVQDF